MAAPRSRRPGFSRKAQLQIFTGYLLAFTGAFAGILLLALSYVDPTAFAALRGVAAEATAPIGRGFAALRTGGQDVWRAVSGYIDAGAKNDALLREAEANRTKLIEARALKQENLQLRKLLGLIEEQGPPVATGRLISSSSSSTRRFATLGVGRMQGIAIGQPVRSPKGLIGRVLEAGPNTARILLLSDPENVVPVKRARDGTVAFTQGRGDGRVDIRLINVGLNPFKVGDVLVTSGNGGLYPPNVPVAIVERLTGDGAIGRLLSNPAATDFVIVQRIFKPELAAQAGGAMVPSDLPPTASGAAAPAAPASAPAPAPQTTSEPAPPATGGPE